MAITIQINAPSLPFEQEGMEDFATWALQELEHSEYNLNILFVDDEEMTDFNEQYRQKKASTNVLSFPFAEGCDESLQGLPIYELGDIIISVDTALREADEFKESVERRFNWLLIHGILHLLGFDHERGEEEALEMFEKEQELLRKYKGEK